MNELAKVVFPRTLDAAAEVARLKGLPARDIALLGSAELAVTARRAGLIDVSRVLVAPVGLSAGRTMFRDVAVRMPLRLVATTRFASKIVVLPHEPRDRKGD